MFPMTLTVHNQAQLSAIMALFAAGETPVADPKPEAAAGKPKAEKTAAKTEPAAGTERTAEAANTAADAPEKKAEASAKAPSYDDVKKAILEVSKTKGREAAIALLGKHGAKTGPELKPEKFAPFLADAKAALS